MLCGLHPFCSSYCAVNHHPSLYIDWSSHITRDGKEQDDCHWLLLTTKRIIYSLWWVTVDLSVLLSSWSLLLSSSTCASWVLCCLLPAVAIGLMFVVNRYHTFLPLTIQRTLTHKHTFGSKLFSSCRPSARTLHQAKRVLLINKHHEHQHSNV